MEKKNNNIICVMCCTNNWYYYLLVNIYSLLNTNKVKKIYLVIEDDNIQDIEKLCNKYNVQVEFININKIDNYIKETSPNYNTKYSKLSMCRLYFTKIINEDKVLYIDADAIVLDDINELWNMRFEENVLIGVKEQGDWDKHLYTTGLNDKYINSGVLLMNLKAIKEEELDESMLYLINKNKYDYPDQDVINLICRNRIGYVSSEYNSTETTGIAENIRIMHYIRGNKGWTNNSPYSYLWKQQEEKALELGLTNRIRVRAIINLTNDSEIGKPRKLGDIWYVTPERYEYLSGNNPKKLVAVEKL
jgi:lipopolysaccharide biosynthesis glycosyltransferase